MPTPTDAFKTALQFTLKWEGGTGHPEDLAGAVYRGISQAAYDTYRQRQKLPLQPVLKISDSEVENLYFEDYWLASQADLMCLPLALVHFDTAVNFSVPSSFKFLQEALGGITVDGNFGPRSMAALQQNNNPETAKRYAQNRLNYRHERVKKNPSQEKFLQGWLRRDNDLINLINQLAVPSTKPPLNPDNKSDDKNEKIAHKLEQAIAILQEVVILLKQPK